MYIDLTYLPNPNATLQRKQLGLLGRMVEIGPCLLEFYHDTPSIQEWRDCITKQSIYQKKRKTKKTEPPPYLWVISSGTPKRVIEEFQLVPHSDWPPGFYRIPEIWQVSLVCLGELSLKEDTFLLAMLAGGKAFWEAVKLLLSRDKDDPLYQQLVPPLVAMHPELRHIFQQEPELMLSVETLYKRWEEKAISRGKEEGREEGREEGMGLGQARSIVLLLKSRGFSVSSEIEEKIRQCRDRSLLDQWLVRAITAPTAEAVVEATGETPPVH